MKFSILVPVYNVEQYLEQCVESLLNQTYKGEYEIILVDDGSTDSSGKICDEYADSHPEKVKVIHKENGGHTSARLAATNAAIGEYCLFCDSDDFIESNLLESVDKVLSKNPNTEMVIYSFSYYENGKTIPRKNYAPNQYEVYEGNNKKALYEILVTTPFLNPLWTKVIKTEILKSDPTDYDKISDKDIAEDAYIISYLLTTSKKIVNINEALYNYRTNQKGISRSFPPEKIERKNILFLYSRFVELTPVWGLNNEEFQNKIYRACFDNAMYLFRKHYENAGNSESRKKVLEYNWDNMLFEEITITPEKYGKPNNVKLYKMISEKKYFKLYVYFLKNKIYNFLKKTKRSILGQG